MSWELSTNLVGPGLEGGESSRPKLLAIVRRSSVWIEWWWKLGSQSLSLMLKSPIMTIVFSRSLILLRKTWRAD